MTVPQHSPSLTAIGSDFESFDPIEILFSHLQPDELFNVFVFGFDAAPGAEIYPPYQDVTITGTTSVSFVQYGPAGPQTLAPLYVNRDPNTGAAQGSDTENLEYYAIPIVADNNGDIDIQVSSALAGIVTTRLSGAALEPIPESPWLPVCAALAALGGTLACRVRQRHRSA